MVDTCHYAFANIHRTLWHKEWTLIYEIKGDNLGGSNWGNQLWNAENLRKNLYKEGKGESAELSHSGNE